MNILLINPHGSNWVEGTQDYTHIAIHMAPIGILALAAYLTRAGHQVKVYDCQNSPNNINHSKVKNYINTFKPGIVGFTAVTSSFHNAYFLAEEIKQQTPQVKIVFGGVHVSALRGKILEKFSAIDFVVTGEGEKAMAELAGGALPQTIQGLVFRNHSLGICENDLRTDLCQLDDLPFPDYQALEGFPGRFEGALFNYPRPPVATIISSRGCVYQCSYCDRSVYRQSFRFNSAEYLYEQMRFLKDNFKIKHIFFYDDLFTFNRPRIVKLCKQLKEKPLSMTFNCAAHLSHLDKELLKLLKSAGCWMISLGIESGSPQILARHKTMTNFATIKSTVEEIQKAGLRAKGLFIMGLPGETEESIQMTVNFINELKLDDMNMTKFTPFPGSPIYQNIQQEGAFEENWNLMNCLNFVFIPKGIKSKERLDDLYKQFIRKFYTSKNWIGKFTLLCFLSPHSFHRIIRNLPTFLKIKRDFKSLPQAKPRGRFPFTLKENIPLRILLVKPHAELLVPIRLQEGFLHLEPLELEIVAGGLDPREEIKILDLGLQKKDQFTVFEKTIKQWQPELVGFTGYSTNVTTIKKLAKIAKTLNNRIITVVGGIHATLLPKDFSVSQIDVIVRGEGGLVLKEILQRFKEGKSLFFDNRALSPQDPEFEIKADSEPPDYPQVDKIPPPRRDLVDRSRYFCVWTSSPTGRLKTLFPQVASLRTSIGCAFSCSFCVIHHLMHHKYLQRQPQDVVSELEGLKEKHIYFLDDEMFLNTQRCEEIAQLLLKKGIKKEYISWARSDTIVKHPEIFKLWKQAGLSTVYVGLESMDEERLVEYNKRLPVETNRKAIAILKDLGITLHASFIVHPEFNEESFKRLEKETLALCPAEVTFTVLSPSPGTDFWKENKEKFICDPYYYYDCMHTILPTRLPLRKFYRHFARLTELALRANPLRANKIKVPLKDFVRAIVQGTKYIIALQLIYRDYLPKKKQ